MIVVSTATKLTMIRGAESYPLFDGTVVLETDDGPVYLVYIADDGLGMAQVARFSERAPSQHGDTDLGFLLEPRVVSYIFAIYAPPTDDSRHLDAARMLLLRRFRPSRDAVSFRYDRANGDVLQIDGHFTGGMHFGSAEREPGTWFQRFSVEFKLPDPTWYDPTEQVYTLTNENWIDGFTVPMVVPFDVGEPHFSSTQAIVYTGTWETYPNLRITGPIRNPTIVNQELSLILPFVGSVGSNTYWDIELTSGLKSVVDATGSSMMEVLGDPNNLDTFCIGADPDVDDGINTIWMYGEESNEDTSLRVGFFNKFIGI